MYCLLYRVLRIKFLFTLKYSSINDSFVDVNAGMLVDTTRNCIFWYFEQIRVCAVIDSPSSISHTKIVDFSSVDVTGILRSFDDF